MSAFLEGPLVSETVSADNTVAAADSGVVLDQAADGKVTTLPNAANTLVGLTVIVRLRGVAKAGAPAGTGDDGSQGHEIAPHSSDKIVGLGSSGTTDKSLLMAKASMKVGDWVKLRCDGVDTWFVEGARGAWTFEG